MPVELAQGSLLACAGNKRDFSPSGIPRDPAARLSHVHKNMWTDTAALFSSKLNRIECEKEERTDGSGPLGVRTLRTVWPWRHVALFICFGPSPKMRWIKCVWKKKKSVLHDLREPNQASTERSWWKQAWVKGGQHAVKGGARSRLVSAYATLNNAPFQMVDPVNPPKLSLAPHSQDAREARSTDPESSSLALRAPPARWSVLPKSPTCLLIHFGLIITEDITETRKIGV